LYQHFLPPNFTNLPKKKEKNQKKKKGTNICSAFMFMYSKFFKLYIGNILLEVATIASVAVPTANK
jgi:hypothetical protein